MHALEDFYYSTVSGSGLLDSSARWREVLIAGRPLARPHNTWQDWQSSTLHAKWTRPSSSTTTASARPSGRTRCLEVRVRVVVDWSRYGSPMSTSGPGLLASGPRPNRRCLPPSPTMPMPAFAIAKASCPSSPGPCSTVVFAPSSPVRQAAGRAICPLGAQGLGRFRFGPRLRSPFSETPIS